MADARVNESETERQSSRQKVAELLALREEDQRKHSVHVSDLKSRLHDEKNRELSLQREQLVQKHEAQLQRASKQHELERHRLNEELNLVKHVMRSSQMTDTGNTLAEIAGARLNKEIADLKSQRKELEEQLNAVTDSDREKANEMRRMNNEHSTELSKVKRDMEQEVRKLLEELRSKDRVIAEAEKELGHQSGQYVKLLLEKTGDPSVTLHTDSHGLGDTGCSPSTLSDKADQSEKRQLEEKITGLVQDKTSLLHKIKEMERRHKPIQDRNRKFLQKNLELSSTNKKLEQRVAALSDDNAKLKSALSLSRKRSTPRPTDLDRPRPESPLFSPGAFRADSPVFTTPGLSGAGSPLLSSENDWSQQIRDQKKEIQALQQTCTEKDKKIQNVRRRQKGQKAHQKAAGLKETFFGFDDDSRSIGSEVSSMSVDTLQEDSWDELGQDEYSNNYQMLCREQLQLQRAHGLLQDMHGSSHTDPQRELKLRTELENDLLDAQAKIEDLERLVKEMGQDVGWVEEKRKMTSANRGLVDKIRELEVSREKLRQELRESQEQAEVLEFRVLELEEWNDKADIEALNMTQDMNASPSQYKPVLTDGGLLQVFINQESSTEINVADLQDSLHELKYKHDGVLTEEEKMTLIQTQSLLECVGKKFNEFESTRSALKERLETLENEKVELYSATTGVSSDIILEYEETRNKLMEAHLKIDELELEVKERKQNEAVLKYTDDFNQKSELKYRKEVQDLRQRLSSTLQGSSYEESYLADKMDQLKASVQRTSELENSITELQQQILELQEEHGLLKGIEQECIEVKRENKILGERVEFLEKSETEDSEKKACGEQDVTIAVLCRDDSHQSLDEMREKMRKEISDLKLDLKMNGAEFSELKGENESLTRQIKENLELLGGNAREYDGTDGLELPPDRDTPDIDFCRPVSRSGTPHSLSGMDDEILEWRKRLDRLKVSEIQLKEKVQDLSMSEASLKEQLQAMVKVESRMKSQILALQSEEHHLKEQLADKELIEQASNEKMKQLEISEKSLAEKLNGTEENFERVNVKLEAFSSLSEQGNARTILNKLEEYESQKEQLGHLKEISDKMAGLQREKEELEKQMDELSSHHEMVVSQKDSLLEELRIKEQKVGEAEDEKSKLSQTLSESHKAVGELQIKINKFQIEKADSYVQKDAQNRIEQLELSENVYKERIRELEKSEEKLYKDLEWVTDERTDQFEKLQERILELQDNEIKLTETITELEENENRLQQELHARSGLSERAALDEEDIRASREQITEYENRIVELEASESLLKDRIRDLDGNMSELNSVDREMKQKNSDLRQKLEDVMESSKVLTQARDELQRKTVQLGKQCADTRQELESMEVKMQEKENESAKLAEVNEGIVGHLENQVVSLKNTLNSAEVSKHDNELAAFQLEERVRKLEAELESETRENQAAEADLKIQLAVLQEENDDLQHTAQEHSLKVSELKKSEAELSLKVSELKQSEVELSLKVSELKQSEAELHSLERELKKRRLADENYKIVVEENRTLLDRNDDLCREIDRIERQLEELTDEREHTKKKVSQLERQLKEKKETEGMLELKKRMEGLLGHYKTEIEDLQSRLDASKAEVEKRNRTIKQLESQQVAHDRTVRTIEQPTKHSTNQASQTEPSSLESHIEPSTQPLLQQHPAVQSDNRMTKEGELLRTIDNLRVEKRELRQKVKELELHLATMREAIESVTMPGADETEDSILETLNASLETVPDTQQEKANLTKEFYESQVGDLKHSEAALQRRVQQMERRENEYKEKMKALEEDYESHSRDMEEKIQELERSNIRLKSKLKYGGGASNDDTAVEKIHQIQDKLLEFETNEKRLKLQLKELENVESDLTERLNAAHKQTRSTEVFITRDREKEEQRRIEIQELHYRIRDLESADNSISEQLRESHIEDNAELKHRIWELEKSEKTLKHKVDFYETQERETEVSASLDSMLDRPEDILRQRIGELEKMERHLKQQISDTEHDREELHEIARKDKGSIHGLNVRIRELSLAEKILKDHVTRFEVSEDLLYSRIDDLEDLVQELESKLKSRTSRGVELSADLKDLRLADNSARTKIELLETNLDDLQNAELNLKKGNWTLGREKEDLSEKLESATLRVNELEESELEAKHKVRSLESEQVVLQGKIIQAEFATEATQERLQQLETYNENLSKKVYNLEEDKANLQFELTETQHQLQEWEKAKTRLTTGEMALREQISKMETAIKNLRKKVKEFEDRETDYKKEINVLERNVSLAQQKTKEVTQDKADLEATIQELKGTVQIHQGQLSAASDLNSVNKSLHGDIEQNLRKIRQLEEQIAELEHKLNVNKYSNLSANTIQIPRHELADLKAQVALVDKSERNVIRLERLEKHLREAIADLRAGKEACGHEGEIKDLKDEINEYRALEKEKQAVDRTLMSSRKEHAVVLKNHEDLKRRFNNMQEHLKDHDDHKLLTRKVGYPRGTQTDITGNVLEEQAVFHLQSQRSPRMYWMSPRSGPIKRPEIQELVSRLPMSDIDVDFDIMRSPLQMEEEVHEKTLSKDHWDPPQLSITHIGGEKLTVYQNEKNNSGTRFFIARCSGQDASPQYLPRMQQKDQTSADEASEIEEDDVSVSAPLLPTSPVPGEGHSKVKGDRPGSLPTFRVRESGSSRWPPPLKSPKPPTPMWLRHKVGQEIKQDEWLDAERKYKNEINGLNVKVNSMENDIKVKMQELASLQKENQGMKREKLKVSFGPLPGRASDRQFEEQQNLNKDLTDQIVRLKHELVEKERKLREAQMNIDRLQKGSPPGTGSVERMRRQLEASQLNMNHKRHELEVLDGQNDIKSMKSQLDRKDRELLTKTNEVTRLSIELREWQQKCKQTPSNDGLQKDYSQLKTEHEQLKNQYEELATQKAASNELDQARSELLETVKELKVKVKDMERREVECHELESQLSRTKEKLTGKIGQTEGVTSVSPQVHERLEKLDELQSQLNTMGKDYRAIQMKLESSEYSRHKVAEAVSPLRARVMRLAKKCKEKDKLLKQLVNTLRQYSTHEHGTLIQHVEHHLQKSAHDEYYRPLSPLLTSSHKLSGSTKKQKSKSSTLSNPHDNLDNDDTDIETDESMMTSQVTTNRVPRNGLLSSDDNDEYVTIQSEPMLNNKRQMRSVGQGQSRRRGRSAENGRPTSERRRTLSQPVKHNTDLFRVVCDYDPANFSCSDHPNLDLPLKEGDTVRVLGAIDSNGYYEAECRGRIGLVPASYLQPIYRQLIPPHRTKSGNKTMPVIPAQNQSPEQIMAMYERLERVRMPNYSSSGSPQGLPTGHPRNVPGPIEINGHDTTRLTHAAEIHSSTSPQDSDRQNLQSKMATILETPPNPQLNGNDSVAPKMMHLSPYRGHRGSSSPRKSSSAKKTCAPAPPSQFKVLRVLSDHSIMISWTPPKMDEFCQNNGHTVTGFKIYLNGRECQRVKSPYLTKALLEKLDLRKPVQLSIQTTTEGDAPSRLVDTILEDILIPSAESVDSDLDSGHDREERRVFVAIYDYDPQIQSPNQTADQELTLKTGDIVQTFGPLRSDGFYHAESEGSEGLAPSSFMEEIQILKTRPDVTPLNGSLSSISNENKSGRKLNNRN